jgi:hypothetical protein
MKKLETIVLCHCGNPERSHNFRHPVTPTIFVEKYADEKGEFFVIDTSDFKPQKVLAGDKCAFPQCNSGKLLHGPVIKHEYVPSGTYEKRVVRFTLPHETLCRTCNVTLEEHKSLTHVFTTYVDVKNKGEHDEVVIRGKTEDQTVTWAKP